MPRARSGRRRRAREGPKDHYETLGVSAEAEHAELKKVYRRLCLENHPDKQGAADREAATARLAEINAAWDVIGDVERRRVYDLQRDGTTSTPRGPRGWARRGVRFVLGADARTFSWASGVGYVRRQQAAGLDAHLRSGRPALLFIHLGGSPRAERAAAAISEAHALLRRTAVLVAAIDAEAEPALAQQLSLGAELPTAVLITTAGARPIEPPLNATRLVAAAAAALPGLPTACTASEFRSLFSAAARGSHVGAAPLAIAYRVRAPASYVMRAACANSRRLLCATVPAQKRCDVPDIVSSCPGIALLASGASRAGRTARVGGVDGIDATLHRCVTEPSRMAGALRAHGLGGLRGRADALAHGAAALPPVRCAAQLGAALCGAPLGSAIAHGVELARTPLTVGAAALAVLLVQALAVGSLPSWMPGSKRRGAWRGRVGGRRFRGRRRGSLLRRLFFGAR